MVSEIFNGECDVMWHDLKLIRPQSQGYSLWFWYQYATTTSYRQ